VKILQDATREAEKRNAYIKRRIFFNYSLHTINPLDSIYILSISYMPKVGGSPTSVEMIDMVIQRRLAVEREIQEIRRNLQLRMEELQEIERQEERQREQIEREGRITRERERRERPIKTRTNSKSKKNKSK
jgi:hypothetical protein